MAMDPKKKSKNVTRVLRAQKVGIDAKINKQKSKNGGKLDVKKKNCKKSTAKMGIAFYKKAKAAKKKKKTVKESFEGYIKHLLKEAFDVRKR